MCQKLRVPYERPMREARACTFPMRIEKCPRNPGPMDMGDMHLNGVLFTPYVARFARDSASRSPFGNPFRM